MFKEIEIYPGLKQVDKNLYLVDLDLPQLEGFRKFISCWIYKSESLTFVVDPGPSFTIPLLVKALQTLNIKHLDLILLTHIHLDHAGGSGDLLEQFPMAKINCHPKGIPHLIDLEKLWQGSLKVLGEIARAYGPVTPVPEHSISYQENIKTAEQDIKITETPGHAAHHICYQFADYLFAGEVAGVNITLKEGLYQRIATPPRFIYEVYKNSLEKASKLSASKMCMGHYGHTDNLKQVFDSAAKQLEFWMETIKKHVQSKNDFDEQIVLQELLTKDPALKLFNQLDKDIRQRERYFCLNSIRGIQEYIQTQLNG